MTTEELGFCPNCGHKVASTDDFCDNCGFNLKAYREAQSNPSEQNIETVKQQPAATEMPQEKQVRASTAQPNNAPARAHTANSKGGFNWLLLLAVIIIVVLAGGGYFFGAQHYSRANQTNELAQKISSGNLSEMKSVAVTADGKPIEQSKLKPLAKLYTEDADSKNEIQQAVKATSTDGVTVIETGKYYGIFPRYSVALTPKTIRVTTNIPSPSFKVNGETVANKKTDDTYQLNDVIVGSYSVKATGNKVQTTKDITVPISGSVKTLAMKTKLPEDKSKATIAALLKKNQELADQKAAAESTASQNTNKSGDIEKTDVDYPSDPSLRNDDDDTGGLVGSWYSGNQTFSFKDDGTYVQVSNGTRTTGDYEVVYRDDDILNIRFSHDGTSSVEPFAFDEGNLIETNLKIVWHNDD